ncbi:MAG TPA: nitrous oxide-stimulated promoter family protein [Spirochaetota bacterium]|nr:nitrous oxide-stimulated promoter family protein [Spirochaetota bacterium]HQO01626.1 nitrous oxide-stimulated promoter family protein [Spirochaetota bacterium]HQP49799.1 nitrous oxide-stimulated promoter family protein [Spirochaetota bacterium]
MIERRPAGASEAIRRDAEVLAEFVSLYCDGHHAARPRAPFTAGGAVGEYCGTSAGELCDECSSLLKYAVSMRIRCPHDPKPSCKKCPSHCYRPEYREKIRKVMKYSGMQCIKKGRVSLLKKYFF